MPRKQKCLGDDGAVERSRCPGKAGMIELSETELDEATGGEDRITEGVALNFSKVEVEYTPKAGSPRFTRR